LFVYYVVNYFKITLDKVFNISYAIVKSRVTNNKPEDTLMTMTIKTARAIQQHLISTNQGFCFSDYGIVSREYVDSFIKGYEEQMAHLIGQNSELN